MIGSFFFSSRRRHTRCSRDWSSDVCSSDLHYNSDGKGDIPEDSARHFSSMESLQIFAADPLVAKPGAKFNYSTYGYTLLGCVLEGAASEKYVGFVKKNVFQPREWSKRRPMTFLR